MSSTASMVAKVLPTVLEVRRALHRNPELSKQEFQSTELVADALTSGGLAPRLRTPRTGLTVDVGTEGPLHVFRADLDALPIQEPGGADGASKVPGVMHACGHDAHTAIAVGLALAWAEMDTGRRVRFLFQPSEEVFPGGADLLVAEGAVDGARSVLAFHVDPHLATGKIGVKPGPITASADAFSIRLDGPGGHTARPHQTVDLIQAAGHVAAHLPGILGRHLDTRAPVAVVFGQIHGGTADNVIPSSVTLSGTARSADTAAWEILPDLLTRLVGELAAPFDARVEVHYRRNLPPVVNDPVLVERLRATLARTMGADTVTTTYTSMGGEDFSLYLREAPGVLLRLGCATDPAKINDLHSTSFRFDEEALPVGLRAGLEMLLELTSAD